MSGNEKHKLAAALLVLAGCASAGPEVRVEIDKDASFERYRTFAFQTPLGTGEGPVTRYLQAATRRELEARGLRYEEASPDLRVNFNGRLSERHGAPLAGPPGGYYSYRQGNYAAWSGYPALEAAPYTVGTLNIDLVDAARRQLVWEGIVTGVVTDKMLTELQQAIDRAVAAAFAQYPRAGSAAR
jgi:hypothetical protein